MSSIRVQQAAVARFAERGYAAVGIRELGRELGLNSASLYHYVASKEELLTTIMRTCLTALDAAAGRQLQGEDDPLEQLRGLVAVHVAMSATNPATCRVTDQEVRSLTGPNRAEVLALRDRYERRWSRVLTHGTRAGRFRTSDARITRLALLDMCTGVANWYRPDGRTTVSRLQQRYAELAAQAVGAAAPGAAPPVGVPRLACEPPHPSAPTTADTA